MSRELNYIGRIYLGC